jgi:hypothetical protein
LKKLRERKFFDSGDYALSKAGCAPQSIVGTAIPNPENIPHASGNGHSNSPTNSTSTNPVNKESGLANENTNVPDDEPLLKSESVPESDLTKLTSDERRIFTLYGKLPPRKDLKKLRERKFFDSGDYALSKAGRAPQSIVGTAIPNPKNIPHASGNGHSNGYQVFSISPTNSTSPVNKEIVPGDEPLLKSESVPESVFKPVSAQGTVVVADSGNTETT